MTRLPQPPLVSGDNGTQITEVRRYLFRLVEELNRSLTSLTSENFSVETRKYITQEIPEKSATAIEETNRNLKALIVKNAETVTARMDEQEQIFQGDYEAISSQFGTFQEEITNKVTQNAEGLEQQLEITTALNEFKTLTNGYIRQGVIGDDEGGNPVIGIAIGQDVRTTGGTVTVDGVEYPVLVKNNVAVLTTEKLSFYINGAEVAYFSNNRLNVSAVKTGNWVISDASPAGYCIRWEGGNG